MKERFITRRDWFISWLIKDEVYYGEKLRRIAKNKNTYFRDFKLIRICSKNAGNISAKATFSDDVYFAHGGKGLIVGEYIFKGKTFLHHNSTIAGNKLSGIALAEPGYAKGNLFVSTGVFIRGDVIIGENVIIGANATITKNIPKNTIAVGTNVFKKIPEKEMLKNFDTIWFFKKNYA